MNEISEFDAERKNKNIDWNETIVFDNSNRAKKAIYLERWR